ncbi:MAG: hypothetical protein ACFBWO_12335 [Paracoccaceae bacterium]
MSGKAEGQGPDTSAGYERSDVRGFTVLIILIAATGFTLVMLGMVTLLISVWQADERGVEDVARWEIAPEGALALQVEPALDMQRLIALEEAQLESYGWIDEEAGIAHIPIEEAMRLHVERERRRLSQDHRP